MCSLNQLLGTPREQNVDGRGKTISDLADVIFATSVPCDSVDWNCYSTCRGSLPKESYSRLIDVITNTDGYTEDERDEVIYEGIWDWLCHQNTLYSVTPLFLDLLLTRFTRTDIPNDELQRLVEICEHQGTKAIYLSAAEIELNRQGLLPIFRIEDILSHHQAKEI